MRKPIVVSLWSAYWLVMGNLVCAQHAELLDQSLALAKAWNECPLQVTYRGTIENQKIASGKLFAWPEIRLELTRWQSQRKLILDAFDLERKLVRGKEYVSDGAATLMIERVPLGDGKVHSEANIVENEVGFADYDYLGLALGLRDTTCSASRYWELRGIRENEWWLIPTLEELRKRNVPGKLRTEDGQTICRFEIPGREIVDISADEPGRILYRLALDGTDVRILEASYGDYQVVGGVPIPHSVKFSVFGNRATEPHLAGQLIYMMALQIDEVRTQARDIDTSVFQHVSMPKSTHVWDARSDSSFTYMDDAASKKFLAEAGINVRANEREGPFSLWWIVAGCGALAVSLAFLGYWVLGRGRR